MKTKHYTINLSLRSLADAIIEERERFQRKALCAWWIFIGFLVTLYVGAFRLIFSLL